jgi:hypothetical protein
MEGKDLGAFEAWTQRWLATHPEPGADVDNPVDGVDGESDPSPCQGIPDATCDSRPGCRMPDGAWCPVFTPPTWGSRW